MGEKVSVLRNENSTYPIVIVNNNNISEKENHTSIIKKPYTTTISIRTAKSADEIAEIQKKTGTDFEEISFDSMCNCNCLEFIFSNPKNEFIKSLIQELKPDCFDDLIKAEALTRTDGIWENCKKYILQKGFLKDKIISYREDVFLYISKLTNDKNIGFALDTMYRVSRGRYVNGIPEFELNILKEIKSEQWFLDIIQTVKFLHSKCFGVSQAKFELAYAWYKIDYPLISNDIFK